WTFARELLAEGLYTPSGNGDVQVWPCLSSTGDAVVIIELSSPDGLALLQAPSRTVHDFVARTHEVVPEGEETSHLAMDAMISQLLGH
ncbi:MAG: SsgA family sporulation/cell division regulator, partial [Marmoricola sp.]